MVLSINPWKGAMPTIRRSITAYERSIHGRNVARLRAAGADLGSGLDAVEEEWITITYAPVGSFVRSGKGGTLFAIDLRIVGRVSKMIIHEFELSCPTLGFDVYLLPDPALTSHSRTHPTKLLYRMSDGERFPRNEVLNHRVDAEGRLNRGDVLEGLLLAQSLGSLPSHFASGHYLSLCLSIVNQFGNAYNFPLRLRLERIVETNRPRETHSKGLLELKEPSDSAPLVPAQHLSQEEAPLGSRR